MKHFLRIVVTLLVLAVIGVACYFFFFKPDSDLKTFNSLSDTIDYRKELGVDAKLNTLISADGHGTQIINYYKIEEFDPVEGSDAKADFVVGGQGYKYVLSGGDKEIVKTEEISFFHKFYSGANLASQSYSTIVAYRDQLLKDGELDLSKVGYRSDANTYSYMVIEKTLDEIFDYYFAYAQICDGVKNSSQKAMDKAIKGYREALKSFNNQLNNVVNYQLLFDLQTEGESVKEIGSKNDIDYVVERYNYVLDSNASARTELTNRYLELIKVYRNTLLKYCDVIDNLKSIVVNYVFGGEIIIESKTVKLDLTLEALRCALRTDNGESVVDAKTISKLCDASFFINGQFGKVASVNDKEDELLLKYNTVEKNAKADLIAILNLDSTQINSIADGSASAELKSKFNEKYLNDIATILNIYGFGVGGR